MKKIVFSGARPTGLLHLGHYYGALKEFLKFQDEYETYFIISDWNMMTTKNKKSDLIQMQENITNMVVDLLSIGFDPDKTKIFVQSNIPEISVIYMMLQNIASMERLQRIPCTVQMAQNSGKNSQSLGLFGFSVLVTSNVMGAQADYVPLGKDATEHLIFAQELISEINSLYRTDFKVPQWLNGSDKEIIGLDGNKKMSKSLDNCIYLCDTEEEVERKVDEIRWVDSYEEDNIVLVYLRLFDADKEKLELIYIGIDHGKNMEPQAKELLKKCINNFLEPIHKKRKYYLSNKAQIEQILNDGTVAASVKYKETLNKLQDAMYFS